MEKNVGKKSLLFQVIKVLVMMYILTGILLLVLAGILYKFEISENMVNAGIIVIYLLSGLVGGFVMGKIRNNRKFVWGMVIGAAYFLILMVVSLVLHQEIENGMIHFFMTLVLCVASGMVGGMIS